MKQLTSFLVFALAALPGCGTKEKKDQPKTEVKPVSEPEPLFHHIENPNDTTLPTETKARNSALEIINEPTHPEVVE